jgi:proton-translocating NAD(P)+ transhydrogenase subunit alpha
MKIAVLQEHRFGETRIAASPETVKKLTALGAEIAIQQGAGEAASIPDKAFEEAGAVMMPSAADALRDADIVLKVQRPDSNELGLYPKGIKLLAILQPFNDADSLQAYAVHGVDAFAMDLMPRITRAQSMDVLSSQSNLAGYKAVIDAAAVYGRAMPMMMTAAGTIAPARVFVMGAGVAGLQAIATARRLGAIVSATDVRFAAKEQVESLGASFVVVDEEAMKEAETAGGYAKEMSDNFKKAQADFVAKHIAKQDIVITTALIPGRPAPRLVSAEMVASMKPGSVIVDLAAEQGGNVEGVKPGEVTKKGGATIIGYTNMAGRLATDASSLYAKNLYNFLVPLINKETGTLEINWQDEIIKGTALTRDGKIIHKLFGGEEPEEAVVPEEAVAAQSPPDQVAGEQSAPAK